MKRDIQRWSLLVPSMLAALLAATCSSAPGDTTTATTTGSGGTGATTSSTGGKPTGTGGAGGSTIGCDNLECQQVECEAGTITAVSGIVLAPTKVSPDPLPNVTVYIPNGAVEPFAAGVACEACGAELSGAPLVLAKSSFDGTFVIENAPAGTNIPLVIQTGRWRRQVTIPEVLPCVKNELAPEVTRLPRNKAEGDIPQMALQTGYNDGLECTLAKLLDIEEITSPSGSGRVHLYRATGKDMDPPLPPASDLWSSSDVLKKYDTVLMPCSATDVLYDLPPAAVQNLRQYTDVGGRLYITHAGGSWMIPEPQPYPGLVVWNGQPDPPSPLLTLVDTTFPKGKTFADWLQFLQVTSTYGELSLTGPQWYADSVNPPAQRWVHSTSPVTLQHFTFNTPVGAAEGQQCGRVLFSNYHVVAGGNGSFPTDCPMEEGLTTNEKLVEYTLFDVTGCVEPDEPR